MRSDLKRLDGLGSPLGYGQMDSVRFLECRRICLGLKPRTLLDIGCGHGLFEAIMPPEVVCTGVDLDPGRVDVARRISASTHRFLQGDLFDLPDLLGDERFDVVLLGEVVEHLESDRDALRVAAGLLSREGALVVTVPNIRRFDNRARAFAGEAVQYMSPNHLREYEPTEVDTLLGEAGLRAEGAAGIGFGFPLERYMARVCPHSGAVRRALWRAFPKAATYIVAVCRPESPPADLVGIRG